MNLHTISGEPAPDVSAALAEFEGQFKYPLGSNTSFRIGHGHDYTRFFRAMGTNACFFAERQGTILGVVSAARRTLILPGGQQAQVVYVGDMKVAAGTLSGRIALRLMLKLRSWAIQFAQAVYSVVMDGTPTTPQGYTGRLGIEPLRLLGKAVILSIPTRNIRQENHSSWDGDEKLGKDVFAELSQDYVRCVDGDPSMRSEMPPRWLVDPALEAAGLVEDTRRAKRLIAEDGKEMIRSHLSCCAWTGHRQALALIGKALRHSAANGFDEMFVSVGLREAKSILSDLAVEGTTKAYASIFGYGLAADLDWRLNTSEI